jgi:hypothetical protein
MNRPVVYEYAIVMATTHFQMWIDDDKDGKSTIDEVDDPYKAIAAFIMARNGRADFTREELAAFYVEFCVHEVNTAEGCINTAHGMLCMNTRVGDLVSDMNLP